MYSSILDDKTLAEVIGVAPVWQEDEEKLAQVVLMHLAQQMTAEPEQREAEAIGAGPEQRFELPVKILAGLIEGEPSPHRIGRAVHELGIKTRRTRDGFLVVWNARQVKILRAYLGV
jgi:hypothetical protein